ncbi:MAG: leucine--tRNA ligase [Bacteroidota bacterium]
MNYPFSHIERKWQQYWDDHETFRVIENPSKQKLFVLDMYPYPSGAGLHVGHPEGYTATDIYCRFKRMCGYNVLHPMGWDAFGLPAERYAMQTGIHPRTTTQQNVATFKRQIKMLGLSYDWTREINTTDPAYYRWTQWIFLRIYNSWYDVEKGKARPISELQVPAGLSEKETYQYISDRRLAYLSEMPVNWCPELGTVLANEEVGEWVDKGYTVERRMMRQWMLRITAYAERLAKDLDELQWSSGIIEMQRNWIGRSEGAEADFPIKESTKILRIYTTRPDTMFGATYMVIAPEHPLVNEVTRPDYRAVVERYRDETKQKSELERTALEKEKSGVFTGGYAINPATKKEIPIWIADYVMLTYGTGAIMAVPGHDQRDYDFAKRYDLPIVEVVAGGDLGKAAYTEEGVAVNSANDEVSLNGLPTAGAKERMTVWLEHKGIGKRAVKYKLRDWLFSRQRYWGEPFPLVYLDDGTVKALPESDLPILLPDIESYKPTGTGESALATAADWLNTVDPETGKHARRETHTMPQWAGSCWYYLRYLDPLNGKEFVSPEKERYWMPIDLYVGGAEHAVLHLLYARFWHKILYDLAYVSTKEPFTRLVNQGTILGEDGQKMSKSRGNVVNPDDVVKEYGADAMRLFEMFMGPLEDTKPWSTRGVEGVYRFLNRVWRMMIDENGKLHASIKGTLPDAMQERLLHQTIKKVTHDIDTLNFNTGISQMMIFVNEFLNADPKPRKVMETFVLLLSPFAPHLAEELWEKLGHTKTLAYEPWPHYDEAKAKVDAAELVVQVNGKVRTKFQIPLGLDDEAVKEKVLADENVKRHIDGKQILKIVVVKNKLVSLVVK